jgi:hypothetical protein
VLRLPVFIIYKRINITAKGEQTYLLEQIDELLLADTSPELATLYHSQEDRLDLIRPRGRYERNTGHCRCVSHSPHKIRQDNWTYDVHEQQVRELSRGGPVSSAPPLASSRPLRYWLRSGHFHLCLIAATGSDVRHEGQRVQDQPWLYCVGGDRGTTELAAMRLERGKKRAHHLVVAVSCLSLSFTFTISVVTSAAFTMSSVKLHSSLPASAAHAGASLQAKSSVLTGVQDAYWSDEEVRSENTSITIHTQLITCLYPFFYVGSEGVSSLPRGDGYFGSQLQAMPMRVPGELQMPSSAVPFSSFHLFSNHMNATSHHRFADSAGITSGEISTINVLRAGGITPTKLANSSLSISKSVYICPIH